MMEFGLKFSQILSFEELFKNNYSLNACRVKEEILEDMKKNVILKVLEKYHGDYGVAFDYSNENIQGMEEENLDIVSEFLVMAATLLEIKSKMLLPKEVNEEGEEIDPRAELVERLLESRPTGPAIRNVAIDNINITSFNT